MHFIFLEKMHLQLCFVLNVESTLIYLSVVQGFSARRSDRLTGVWDGLLFMMDVLEEG